MALATALLAPSAAYADIVTTTENTAVILRSPSNDAFCSGTVIAVDGTDEIIATARHCAVGGPDKVQFFDGDIGQVQTFLGSPTDIMLLMVHSMHRHEHARMSTIPIRRDQSLYVFGMPLSDFWSLSRAYSTTGSLPTHDETWPDSLRIDCTSCNHGSSGGGVFDTKGRLVGVLVGGRDDAAGHILIEPVQDVIDLISTLGGQHVSK